MCLPSPALVAIMQSAAYTADPSYFIFSNVRPYPERTMTNHSSHAECYEHVSLTLVYTSIEAIQSSQPQLLDPTTRSLTYIRPRMKRKAAVTQIALAIINWFARDSGSVKFARVPVGGRMPPGPIENDMAIRVDDSKLGNQLPRMTPLLR